MFLGEFGHSIDEKGRITIPAKFRGQLVDGVVVTKGIDPCLWLYPIDAWKKLAPKISALPITRTQAREFRRQVFGGASDSVPDRNGRVNLPPYLRQYANIDNRAVIVGLDDHCEIWNPDDWSARQKLSHDDPQSRADMFGGLEI
jgi:MraZ protein